MVLKFGQGIENKLYAFINAHFGPGVLINTPRTASCINKPKDPEQAQNTNWCFVRPRDQAPSAHGCQVGPKDPEHAKKNQLMFSDARDPEQALHTLMLSSAQRS